MKKYFLLIYFMSQCLTAQWVATNAAFPGDIKCIASSGTNIFIGAYSGGVYLSTDNGNNWSNASAGLNNTLINSIAVNNTNIYVGTYGGGVNRRSTDNGAMWEPVLSGMESNKNIYSLATIGTNVFAGTESGGAFISTNNGSNWTQIINGLTDNRVYSFAVNGGNLYAGTYYGVFHTTNQGTNWTEVSNNLNINILALAISNSKIYAGTAGGGVYLSDDNGGGWTNVINGFTNQVHLTINALAVSGSNIYAGTVLGGVYLTINNGASWSQVNTGFPNSITISSLAVIGSYLFAGSGGGSGGGGGIIWRRQLSEMQSNISVKNAIPKQWLVISAGSKTISLTNTFQGNIGTLSYTAQSSNNTIATVAIASSTLTVTPVAIGDAVITVTAIDAANNDFFAYSFPVNIGLTDVEGEAIPTEFALYQNFPNPFNPTTNIKFALPKESNVTLRIYNVLGQEVETLVNKVMPAGYHTVDFNATKLSSGMYIYRIEAGDFVQVKKMLLMK
ncbi:MAG: T9SS type A sorting domain-containing protein [Ignavibacteriales bacterium]|nr:T9SS type A sorting domain-containing protein [Ignavibacteriales bacterium]